jgi:hypothetical protein
MTRLRPASAWQANNEEAGMIKLRRSGLRLLFRASSSKALAKRTLMVTNLEKDPSLGRIGKVAQLGSVKCLSVPKSAGNQQAAIAQQSGRVAVARGV